MAWRQDPAAMNIAEEVLSIAQRAGPTTEISGLDAVPLRWAKSEVTLVYLEESPLYSQEELASLRPDTAVVLSKHRSEAEIPCLTVHCTGNFGEAKYGGDPRRISIAPAAKMRAALLELRRQAESLGLHYSVSYEVTHHGPTVDFPIMFLEIGSSEHEWTDPNAGRAVAMAALISSSSDPTSKDVCVGIGGPHYAPLFTSLSLRGRICFGHMVSWHQLPDLDEEILPALITRNVGSFKSLILDWKGLRKERDRMVSLLKKMAVPYERA